MEINLESKHISLFDVNDSKKRNHFRVAESFVRGKLIIVKGLDSIDITEKIDWNYKHKNSSNTYKLYLHTLSFIRSLVYTSIEKKDDNLQKLASLHLHDWIESNYHNYNDTEKVWYDHTVSSRIGNIIYFQIYVEDKYKVDEKLFSELVAYHLEFMADPKNYNETNHGIMVDRSIIKVVSLIKNDETKDKYLMLAKGRIEKAIIRDYSYKHMHLENSPAYHRMVTKWLSAIAKTLDQIGSPLGIKYLRTLDNAEKLNGTLINYNGEFPMIGDTSYVKTNIQKSDSDFYDHEAGIAILNNKQTESTLIFNNGFQTKGHKHFDDLSFVLSVRKEQIFIDSGKYNYSSRDPIRKYLVSPKAHNTLTVKDKTYKLVDKKDIELTTYLNFGKFKYLAGVHNAYDSVNIKRVIVSFDGINTIIIDKVRSSENDEFTQNYILNHDIDVKKVDNNSFSILTPNKKEYKITSHIDSTRMYKYYGKKEQAFVSEKFGKTTDTSKIEIKNTGKKLLFITSFLDKDSNLTIVKSDFTAVRIKFNENIFTIPIF